MNSNDIFEERAKLRRQSLEKTEPVLESPLETKKEQKIS